MPRLIPTPEQILRTTQADLYFIRFTNGQRAYRAGVDPEGKSTLDTWLAGHLPDARLELMGPSEFSGILCGGIGADYAFHVSVEGIAEFAAYWEGPDGSSRDPRWQCIWYPLEEFERRIAEHGDPLTWAY